MTAEYIRFQTADGWVHDFLHRTVIDGEPPQIHYDDSEPAIQELIAEGARRSTYSYKTELQTVCGRRYFSPQYIKEMSRLTNATPA